MSVIEVRLIDPPGTSFLTDDWTELDAGGYVLRNPAHRGRGGVDRAMANSPTVRVPRENVQYTIETDE